MSPVDSIRRARLSCVALAFGALAPGVVLSQGTDVSTMYRCPGNDYKNTISAKEAAQLGCKKLEGAPITVIQSVRPRAGVSASPSGSAASGTRVDPSAQRERDSDARRILDSELHSEEGRLADLQKEFNGGEPERQGNEKNYAKYQERLNDMKAAIARKEADIAAIKREIAKLPK